MNNLQHEISALHQMGMKAAESSAYEQTKIQRLHYGLYVAKDIQYGIYTEYTYVKRVSYGLSPKQAYMFLCRKRRIEAKKFDVGQWVEFRIFRTSSNAKRICETAYTGRIAAYYESTNTYEIHPLELMDYVMVQPEDMSLI